MRYVLEILIGSDTGLIHIDHINGERETIYKGSKPQAKAYYQSLTINLK